MFTSIFDSVMKEASIAPYVAMYNEFVAKLGVAYNILLIGICLLIGVFGRRLSGLVRVVLLFSIGFVASVYWLCPLITPLISQIPGAPQIPGYAIGLSVGFVAALFSRLIYNGVYIGAIGLDTYNICFTGMFFVQLTAFTKGNLPVSIGIACAVTLLALFIRKYLEMIITAAAGGVGIAYFANRIYNYTSSFGTKEIVTLLAVGAVLAFPMVIYQYRHRVIFW